MAKVLMIGVDPDLVDFSDPALPPGLSPEVIRSGIGAALEGFRAAGHDPAHAYIPPDPGDLGVLDERLKAERFDCVLVGGGVRLPPKNLALFEAVLNVIARQSPSPAIALASSPADAVAAVQRALAPV